MAMTSGSALQGGESDEGQGGTLTGFTMHYLNRSMPLTDIDDIDAFLSSIRSDIGDLPVGVHILGRSLDILCVLNAEWSFMTFALPPSVYTSRGHIDNSYGYVYLYGGGESIAKGETVIDRVEAYRILATIISGGDP